MYQRMFQSVKLKAGTKSETATGGPIMSKGVFRATLIWENCDNEVGTKIHVLDELQQPVLSNSTQRKFGMIPAGYPHEKADHRPISEIFRNILAISTPTTQLTKVVSHPSAKEVAKPVSMRGSRPVAVELMPSPKEELNTMSNKYEPYPRTSRRGNAPQRGYSTHDQFLLPGPVPEPVPELVPAPVPRVRRFNLSLNGIAKSTPYRVKDPRCQIRQINSRTHQLTFKRPVRNCLPAHRTTFARQWQKETSV